MVPEIEMRDRRAAYALLRIFLGTDILMHGVSRLMAAGAFQTSIESQFAKTPLPHLALAAFGVALPWAEALIGLFVLIGLGTRAALVAGALLMSLLAFGSGLIQNWNAAGVQLLYALVYSALLFLRRFNGWSLDALLSARGSRA